jgi:PucR family transcriptional regulator, proline-responsive transcriptional activator
MGEIGLNQRVVVSAVHQGRIYGYIWVQEIEKLTDEELHFLHEVSFHISKVLYQQNYNWNYEKTKKKMNFIKGLSMEPFPIKRSSKWGNGV